MGGLLKKVFKKRDALAKTPEAGGDSKSFTGIKSGRQPANEANQNRRPGRRGADTPLGPSRQRM